MNNCHCSCSFIPLFRASKLFCLAIVSSSPSQIDCAVEVTVTRLLRVFHKLSKTLTPVALTKVTTWFCCFRLLAICSNAPRRTFPRSSTWRTSTAGRAQRCSDTSSQLTCPSSSNSTKSEWSSSSFSSLVVSLLIACGHFNSWMTKIGSKLMNLVMEQGVPELTAWNQCSNDLISIARVSRALKTWLEQQETNLKNSILAALHKYFHRLRQLGHYSQEQRCQEPTGPC